MEAGRIIPVVGPIKLLSGRNRGQFPFSHSFIIDDADTALIDTGPGLEVLRPWAEPGRIDLVLNTHTHPDHSAGNHLFDGVEILVPEPAFDVSGDKTALSERFAEPGELAEMWRRFVTETMGFADQRPTGAFTPGQEIRIGRTRLIALNTPGHTIDHTVFHLPQHDAVLSADIDLTPFGPWYGHRESDLGRMRADIRLVMDLKPKVLIPSHGEPLTSGIQEALSAYLAKIDEREDRILKFLARERSRDEIVEAALIYGGFPYFAPALKYWEGQMIDRHLAELIETGAVVRTETGRYRAV